MRGDDIIVFPSEATKKPILASVGKPWKKSEVLSNITHETDEYRIVCTAIAVQCPGYIDTVGQSKGGEGQLGRVLAEMTFEIIRTQNDQKVDKVSCDFYKSYHLMHDDFY